MTATTILIMRYRTYQSLFLSIVGPDPIWLSCGNGSRSGFMKAEMAVKINLI
jgi:hypothetical protein